MKKLPIGMDDFKKIREEDCYYVDKTKWIKELVVNYGEVNLFTRPRRFGKTLNMSMLKSFFEVGTDPKIFAGLYIFGEKELCEKHMGQYPVIFLTLKSAKQPTYELAYTVLKEDIGKEFARHDFILKQGGLSDALKEKYIAIRDGKAGDADYVRAIAFLSECLEQYYHKKVIILIDEYDVPLENAYYQRFYESMSAFIRSLFESALKSNPHLAFAVVTGCLRISKESIFTGLNNLKINSILSEGYGEFFGFNEAEVKELLRYYHCEEFFDTVKDWYDGYLFGNVEVYNPWSVLNYIEQLTFNKKAFPTAAWSNSSANTIIRDLINRADASVKEEIQDLLGGKTIEKKVQEDITYEDIYVTEDSLWNFLLFTGYLKPVSVRLEEEFRYIKMAIPNREIRSIYIDKINHWFSDTVKSRDLNTLYHAMLEGDAQLFEKEMQQLLYQTISYMDAKEAFYHGFVLGILANLSEYIIKSNRESEDGRYDICIYQHDVSKPVILLELKVAEKFKKLDSACDTALEQVKNMKYIQDFEEDGYSQVVSYGIAFFKKQVRVKIERIEM